MTSDTSAQADRATAVQAGTGLLIPWAIFNGRALADLFRKSAA
jgi:hypothetical protein